MSMKIVTIVGARPQFIKASAISREIRDHRQGRIEEVLVHTGQHYDENMSGVFFEELGIPAPKHNLNIAGGTHGVMTGRMLEAIEGILLQERPDWVLIYGDTNSTLAGALAAAKLHIPVAHVEAGLRSFNMRMPEEVNRILSDRVSNLLLCPTETAVRNLAHEGIVTGVHNVGDVMFDVALYYGDQARQRSSIMQKLGLAEKDFFLATCHRAENTDDPARLTEIVAALGAISASKAVVLPLHPRTRKLIDAAGLGTLLNKVQVVEPLAFLDMIALEQGATAVLTDSGGVQKEAFFYKTPCITLRDETEWVETVDSGWNRLVGADRNRILDAVASLTIPDVAAPQFGHGDAAKRSLDHLETT